MASGNMRPWLVSREMAEIPGNAACTERIGRDQSCTSDKSWPLSGRGHLNKRSVTQPWKELNNAVYSNVDGPRDYHTKQTNSERDKCYHLCVDSKIWHKWAYLVAQTVKNPPAVQEPFLWSLGQEDPLEKGLAIHSSILAWGIPWTEEPGRLQSMGSQKVRHDWASNTHT